MDINYENIEWDKFTAEEIKENLFFSLINYEKNKEKLSDIPYIKFLDLAVVFNYMVDENGDEIHSFRVDDRIMKTWGLNAQEMYDIAMGNMDRLFPEIVSCITNIVRELEGKCHTEMIPEYICDSVIHVYVLTNKRALNGASAMLYSKKLGKLADILESNLYILPSSVHEVIAVPTKYYQDAAKLIKLVNDVNSDTVEPKDRLSDNVYVYERADGSMYIYENRE